MHVRQSATEVKTASLIAVVRRGRHEEPFWCALPPQPWPQWIRLWRGTTDSETALVLFEVAYRHVGNLLESRETQSLLPSEVKAESMPAISGGLAARSATVAVYPGCCAFLNEWREWHRLLEGQGSPWLGHDPSPWVERWSGSFYAWPDEWQFDRRRRSTSTVRFSRGRLAEALRQVERDLKDFVAVLTDYVQRNVPESAASIAAAVSDTIVRGRLV